MVRSAGLATYPFYLLHESIGGTVLGALVAGGWAAPIALVIAVLATLACSLLVSESAEPWLRRLLARGIRVGAA